ncbi:MAG: diaminopimelate decarboxylase [Candidatus Omnitrophota bacterium]
MHDFCFRKNSLYCEDLPVASLAKRFGTPLFVYSSKTIIDHYSKIKAAFKKLDPLICYSAKVNSNLSVMKLLVARGAGLDIVSGGELYRARLVNCPAKKIVYASVGKTDREIKEAISYGILMFTVESLPELARINALAKKLRTKVDIGLRFNPEVKPKTHSYIVTGAKETKFGMDADTLKNIFLRRRSYSHLNIVGIHIHVGSQITESKPYLAAIKKVKILVQQLSREGISLKFFDIGGGLGIIYDKEKPQTAKTFAEKVLPLLKEISLKVILEPGRFIVGNAGILVTKVLYLKDTSRKKFIIVDSGMNDLIRPSLYGAYHKIVPLKKKSNFEFRKSKLADVVGPICESGDFLGKDRDLNVKEGDFLAVMAAGAYSFSMSSNYNSRPRAAEVLVKNGKAYLVRRRESYTDLVKGESIR